VSGGVHRGRRVEKPWGFELIWAEPGKYLGKLLHVERGESLSFQYHERKDETIRVLRGVLELEVGEVEDGLRKLRLEEGDCFHIPPGLRHRMTAVETCDVMEVSTPEADDVVRLVDRYGRVGTKAP